MRYVLRTVRGKRTEFVDYLAARIPGLEIHYDESGSNLQGFIDCLEKVGDDPHVNLEDDIILTQNFGQKINFVISQIPKSVIQFFSMRKDDLTKGSRWDSEYLMGQCTYFPAGYARAIIDYRKTEWKPSYTPATPFNSDTLVRHFLQSRKEKYWIHIPNLVEHRVSKSIIDPRRSSKRQSLTFSDPWL